MGFAELQNFVVKLAIEHCEAEIITKSDISALFAEKEVIGNESEESDENLAVLTTENQLVLETNPEEYLDQIIERV